MVFKSGLLMVELVWGDFATPNGMGRMKVIVAESAAFCPAKIQ
jgi:hypothetical protein